MFFLDEFQTFQLLYIKDLPPRLEPFLQRGQIQTIKRRVKTDLLVKTSIYSLPLQIDHGLHVCFTVRTSYPHVSTMISPFFFQIVRQQIPTIDLYYKQ